MNRADFQRLANARIADAKALLAARRWSAAYYLAGYAVECGLKACILARVSGAAEILFEDKRFSEKCWTHNLSQLMDLGGLSAPLTADLAADPELFTNWTTVKDWRESRRYARTTKAKAEDLYDAITDKKHGGTHMDQATLVERQIEDGRRFIERLGGEGIPVTAAAWVKEDEDGPWFLYLVTPLVSEDGPTRPAYRRVNAVFLRMPQPFWIEPLGVKVVGPDGPVGKAILDLQQAYPGRFPMWYRGVRLGDVSVEGTYVYPPASTPATRADKGN